MGPSRRRDSPHHQRFGFWLVGLAADITKTLFGLRLGDYEKKADTADDLPYVLIGGVVVFIALLPPAV